MRIFNTSPNRSPLKVASEIKDLIKDKLVCDIGCRDGDMMAMFSRYAKKVIGMEKDELNYKLCKGRGLDVLHADAFKYLRDADVYYVWIHNGINQDLARKILTEKPGSMVIVGGDRSVGEIYDFTGEKRSFEYNEGIGERQRGTFDLHILRDIKEAKKGD